MANDELRILRFSVIGRGHIARRRTRIVPATNILERAIPNFRHSGRSPWTGDVCIVCTGSRQNPEQVWTIGVSSIRDTADLGSEIVAAEDISDEALARVSNAVRVYSGS